MKQAVTRLWATRLLKPKQIIVTMKMRKPLLMRRR